MHKLIIIFIIIYAISALFGDYLIALLNTLSGTMPIIFQPLAMFFTFYNYVFDVVFSNYYVSLFINIFFVFVILNFVLDFLLGKAYDYIVNAPKRKEQKIKKQAAENKRMLRDRQRNVKTIKYGGRSK